MRGKRHRADASEFLTNLDRNLIQIQQEIRQGTFKFGIARQFMVFDPKPRKITAPRFEERIVHHAIMNLCESYLDRLLIDDTYACRVGKGREK